MNIIYNFHTFRDLLDPLDCEEPTDNVLSESCELFNASFLNHKKKIIFNKLSKK